MQGYFLNELKRERLFGKELTNIVDAKYSKKDFRLNHHSKKNPLSQRGASEDLTKRNASQACKTSRHLADVSLKPLVDLSLKPTLAESVKKSEPSEPAHDVQMVPEYFDDCFQFMLRQEKHLPAVAGYMAGNKDLNESMRVVLLDWLLDIHFRLKMFPSTLFLTVSLIDRYLSGHEIPRSKLQLVGATARFMAAKYEETYEVPELAEMVRLCAKVYTKAEFLDMEAAILKHLDFDLVHDSSYKFLEPLARLDDMEKKHLFLARYILELALFDLKSYRHRPSMLAAAAVYLANKLKKKARAWGAALEQQTGYSEQEIRPCAKELLLVLEKAAADPLLKSIKKKFSSAAYCEVSKLRFEKKEAEKEKKAL